MLFEIASIITLIMGSIYNVKRGSIPNLVLMCFAGSALILKLLVNGIVGLLTGAIVGLLAFLIGYLLISLKVWDFSDAIVLMIAVILMPFKVFWIIYYTTFFIIMALLYMFYLSLKPYPDNESFSEEIALPIVPAILLGVTTSIILI